ncbi:MAG TPA: phage holin family protein [Mucilaginibacter sp.]|jgi:hypothetical protein|nr:phage holin family protein [Mucilaginibacter sp.]
MEAQKETPPPQPPPLVDQLKEYAETRIKLAKYQAIEGGTTIAASIIAEAVAIGSVILAFIFASFALAFYLADLLHDNWKGFGIVAVCYIIFAVILKYNKQTLEKPIANTFIQKIFKK